jgi:hypothetical protein
MYFVFDSTPFLYSTRRDGHSMPHILKDNKKEIKRKKKKDLIIVGLVWLNIWRGQNPLDPDIDDLMTGMGWGKWWLPPTCLLGFCFQGSPLSVLLNLERPGYWRTLFIYLLLCHRHKLGYCFVYLMGRNKYF